MGSSPATSPKGLGERREAGRRADPSCSETMHIHLKQEQKNLKKYINLNFVCLGAAVPYARTSCAEFLHGDAFAGASVPITATRALLGASHPHEPADGRPSTPLCS